MKKKDKIYQPSGAGGTRSPPAPPAKYKMAARVPQNDDELIIQDNTKNGDNTKNIPA